MIKSYRYKIRHRYRVDIRLDIALIRNHRHTIYRVEIIGRDRIEINSIKRSRNRRERKKETGERKKKPKEKRRG